MIHYLFISAGQAATRYQPSTMRTRWSNVDQMIMKHATTRIIEKESCE
jgi:hypothetical protein